jgi:hypothetical protein
MPLSKKPAPLLWRITRVLILLAGLLVTAAAFFLAQNPRLKPRDLLAPFSGADWVFGKNGLDRHDCLSPDDCRHRIPKRGCQGWWRCQERRCEWHCAPTRNCKVGSVDACGPREFCDAYYCSHFASGVCAERPPECGDDEQIICGCDGKLYLNDCERRRAGVALRYIADKDQPCLPEGQRFFIGPAEANYPDRPARPEPRCCCGLHAIRPPTHGAGECSYNEGGTGLHVCAACGDGRCGAGEDRCNCPRDCRPPEVQIP